MSLDILQEAVTLTALQEYSAVSMAFVVDRILQVTVADGGLGGLSLTETALADPYVKDYDALRGAEPVRWLERFDTSNWGLIRGRRDGLMVGGAVVAFNSPGVRMLGGRDDIAVLWDIRVWPEERGAGLGSALFQAAADWAVARGCGWLKIETAGNAQPLLDSLADDIQWTIIGSTGLSGTYHGKREVTDNLLARVRARLATPITFTIDRLIADGEYVATQARGQATAVTGLPYNNTYCIVARIVHGQIREMTDYIDTELVTRALLGTPTA